MMGLPLSRWLWPLALGVLLLGPAPAFADSDAVDVHTEAVQLAREGVALYREGRYAEALTKYEAAYRTFPAPALVLNLSRTELKLGHCDSAIAYARTFAGAFGEKAAASTESPRAWLETLQSECPDVEITADAAGAQLFVDDVPRSHALQLPWRGHLQTGEHQIVVHLNGYRDQRSVLVVAAGRSSQTRVDFSNEAGSLRVVRDSEDVTSSPVPLWAPFVPAVIAAGGLALAIGEGVGATECAQRVNPASIVTAAGCQSNHAALANTGWGIAGVGAATAATLWIVRLLVPERAARGQVQVGVGGNGLLVAGRF